MSDDVFINQIKKMVGKPFVEPKRYKALSGAIFKAQDEVSKSLGNFHKQRDALSDAVVDLQSKLAKLKFTRKAMADALEDETYGIDESDTKAIAKVQDYASKAMAKADDELDDNESKLDELEKHIQNIQKYKGPS